MARNLNKLETEEGSWREGDVTYYRKRFFEDGMNHPVHYNISGCGRYWAENINSYEISGTKGRLQDLAQSVPEENLGDLGRFVDHKLKEAKDQGKSLIKMSSLGLGMLLAGSATIYSFGKRFNGENNGVNEDTVSLLIPLVPLTLIVAPTIALVGALGYIGNFFDVRGIKKAKSTIKHRLHASS